MRKIPLSEKQVQQLRADKQSGLSMADLMFKYNVGKSSVYSYLSTKEEQPAPPNTPKQEAITVQIEPIESETDYLDNIFIKDDGEKDEEGDKDEIVQEINKNIKEKIQKKQEKPAVKEPRNEDTMQSLFDNFMGKNKEPEVVQKEEKQKPSPKTAKQPINPAEKMQKIMKIKNYVHTFKDKLSDILDVETKEKQRKYIMSLSKMTESQIDVQLEMIRQSVGTVTSHKAVKLGYMSVMEVVEKLGGRFVDIEGFRKDVEDNDQIDQVLKELSCEYDIFSKYVDPKYRLIGLTGFQLMSTYKKNKIIKHQQAIINSLQADKPVDKNIEEKYNDI